MRCPVRASSETGGPSWQKITWPLRDKYTPERYLPGLELSPIGTVTAISLPENNLNGCVARGLLKGLPYLAMLDLPGNRGRDGSLPGAALGALVMLKVLNLGGCSLDGPFPPQIALTTQVQELRLGDNELSGPAAEDRRHDQAPSPRPLTEQASHTEDLLPPSLF